VMTMFDSRTKLSEQVVQEVQRYFGELVYGVIIPRTVRLSEAPGFGQPITVYDAKSKGAEAYRLLAQEVALRPPPDMPMPTFDQLPVAVMAPIERTPLDDEATTEESEIDEMRSPSDRPTRAEPDGGEPAVGPGEPHPEGAPEGAPEPALEPAPEPTAEAAREPAAEAEPASELVPPQREAPVETPPAIASAPTPRHEERAVGKDEDLWEEPPPEPEARVKPPSRPVPPGELPQRRVVVIDENRDIDIEAGQEEPPPPPGDRREGIAGIGATLDEEKGRKRRWRMFRKGGD
jgi:hypothetical protein